MADCPFPYPYDDENTRLLLSVIRHLMLLQMMLMLILVFLLVTLLAHL